jgi:hypothetical protein
MKPASPKPAPGHHRCFYHSATGRQCRSWVIDPRGMFCPRHCAAQPNGPDDLTFHLLQRSCNFQNAEGIRDSLSRLYSLLAADAISPRRAAVLGYLTSLLLRTLPALYNDPTPKLELPSPPPNWPNEKKPNPSPLPHPRREHPNLPHPCLPRNPHPHQARNPYLPRIPSFLSRLFRNQLPSQRPIPRPLLHRQQPHPQFPQPPQLSIKFPKAPALCRPPAPNSPLKSSNP